MTGRLQIIRRELNKKEKMPMDMMGPKGRGFIEKSR